MNATTDKIIHTILSTIAEQTFFDVKELRARCDTDDVATEVDRYIAEHPEEFGLSEPPKPPKINFLLDLGRLLPYYNDSIELSFYDCEDTLRMSVVLLYERELELENAKRYLEPDEYERHAAKIEARYPTPAEREKLVARYMAQDELSEYVTLEDGGDMLILTARCELDDLWDIETTLAAYLEVLQQDEGFAEVIRSILGT